MLTALPSIITNEPVAHQRDTCRSLGAAFLFSSVLFCSVLNHSVALKTSVPLQRACAICISPLPLLSNVIRTPAQAIMHKPSCTNGARRCRRSAPSLAALPSCRAADLVECFLWRNGGGRRVSLHPFNAIAIKGRPARVCST